MTYSTTVYIRYISPTRSNKELDACCQLDKARDFECYSSPLRISFFFYVWLVNY